MKDKELALFYIKDEQGNKVKAGAIAAVDMGDAVALDISVFKEDVLEDIISGQPAGGYIITDGFSGGRIEVVTGGMNINYKAITGAIDAIRDRFKLPLVAEPPQVRKAIAVKPNPTRS